MSSMASAASVCADTRAERQSEGTARLYLTAGLASLKHTPASTP
jgi:hypothetical protein